MIIQTRSDEEYEDALYMLRIINELRSQRGLEYCPPPHVRTVRPRPEYL